jgi:hypothetical protein
MERDRKLKLKADNAALLATEEAELASISRKGGGGYIKKKNRKKDSLEMLHEALASAPKTKEQKRAEAKKQESEARQKSEEMRAAANQARREAEEAFRLEQARLGIILDHAEDLMQHSKDLNSIEEDEEDENTISASGVDSAIDVLSGNDSATKDPHPEKRRRALYQSYCERMMPCLREDFPGLRLNQYQERIFESWQKAPENPMNMPLR